MSDNGQVPMFYEDIIDAILKMVNGNPKGLSIKQIAADLWPARNPDTARSALSRALNPENHDVQLNPEELDKTMEITEAPQHVIFYLCDKYGFERPAKKDKKTFQKEIKDKVSDLSSQVQALMKQIKTFENVKD